MSSLGMHRALLICMAFQIPRIKTFCQILVSSTSGSFSVKQLALIICHKCLGDGTAPTADAYRVSLRQTLIMEFSASCQTGKTVTVLGDNVFVELQICFSSPIAFSTLAFTATIVARLLVFKPTEELKREEWDQGKLKRQKVQYFFTEIQLFDFFLFLNKCL